MENGYPLAALFLLRNLRASNTSGNALAIGCRPNDMNGSIDDLLAKSS